MNNEKVRLALELIKAMAMLLGVCGAIIFSVDMLLDTNIFSIKRMIALAILLESLYSINIVL